MKRHAMLDLETLSLRPNAMVVSVGLVLFTAEKIVDHGYWVLHREEQAEKGRHVSQSTLKWWMQQRDEVRSVFAHDWAELTLTRDFFREFEHMLVIDGGLWGNGAAFDNAVLRSLFEDFSYTPPWSYKKDYCYRTIRSLDEFSDYVEPERQGTYHNALDDALHQAKVLQQLNKRLGGIIL